MFLRPTAEAKLSEAATPHKKQSGASKRTSHAEAVRTQGYSGDEESRTPMSLTC